MAVSLKKGQKVSLVKSNGKKILKLMVGLGWDAVEQPQGFFSRIFNSKDNIDCDASVFLCKNGKFVDNDDLVYFGNLEHYTHAVKHMGDNLTGDGEGDDEEIYVDLTAVVRNQHFGMIKNAFIRIVDNETNEELCRYNLSENYDGMLSMIVGEVYRRGDEWKFNAIGNGTKDANLTQLSEHFR